MALRLIEGFDHLSSQVKLATKGWTATLGTSLPGVSLTFQTGRLGGKCVQLSGTNPAAPSATTSTLVKALSTPSTTQILGFAINLSRLPITNLDIAVLKAGATLTLRIGINSSGQLVLRNSVGTTLATGTFTMAGASWYYIEIKAFANGASGTVEAQINGTTEIASTTANIGSANLDTLDFRVTPSGLDPSLAWTVQWDDVYVCDASGSTNNTFLGDVRVSTIMPSADGAHSDFTPSTGTAHFSLVNEATSIYPDDDSSYVSSSTVGHRDSYAYGNVPSAAGTVFGVQTNLYARKDDAAVRQIAAVARPGSTDQDGATVTLGTTYSTFTEIRETNPDTTVAWTISDINASEFGVKVVA